jgi:membrane protein YqaA with SNARE-associated domain
MWWQYLLVFVGSMAVDIVPIPLPPAFTVMILLQILFDLNIWIVLAVGVAGSIAGRYILSLYIPKVSGRLFKRAKNEDVQYLGKRLKEKGWKSHALILIYSLMPLPTTPLFVAGGMAKLHPMQIIPAFFVGKMISDLAAILLGKEAVGGTEALLDGMVSWKSITGLVLGLLLLFALIFFDWRSLLQHHRLRLKFNIWR